MKVKSLSTECEKFFKDYPHNSSIEEQVKWLRAAVPNTINPNLFDCILNVHKIADVSTFNRIISDYWQGRKPVINEIKLQTILDDYSDKNKNYDFFISFPIANEVISHKLESNFTTSPPCYSIPFFEALAEKYKNTAILVLNLGKVNGNVTVVFTIKDSVDSFYDYSQIPPFIGGGNAIHVAV